MRFSFTDDQRLFRDAVRDVLKKDCTEDVVRAAWEGRRESAVWAKLAEMGVLGVTVPETHGGMGLDELSLVLLLEETGRVALPEPIVETVAVAVPVLRALGPSGDRWLSAIAKGELKVGVRLDPTAHVPHADACGLLLVQRGSELHAVAGADAVLVPRTSVDRARYLFEVDWKDGTHVATGAVLADAFDRGALGVAAQLLGLSQHMLDRTVEYTKVREQFGKPIGSFQAVKHHLANALLAIEFARPVVYRAAYSVAKGDSERSVHVSMAKAFASEAAETVSRAALQCHGAIGYAYEHGLHMWMKRAWALGASWGDAGWHRQRIARAVLG
jgi:alkylation response protein AidB-like acyl-CoA dehydrogenase